MGSTGSIYLPHQPTAEESEPIGESDYKLSYHDQPPHHTSSIGGVPPSGRPPRSQQMQQQSQQHHKDHIEKNVNNFLSHQISAVSMIIHEQRSQSVPKISSEKENTSPHQMRQVVSSTHLVKKNSTVRAHALRLHSRQKNTYISASSLKFSSMNRDRSQDYSGSSLVPNHLNNNESIALNGDPAITAEKPSGAVPGGGGGDGNPLKKKFNLKLQINDEEDWIQVDDEDAGDIMTPRVKKEALGHADQSYTLTQSGTIFVNGFGEGIGKNGLAVGSRYQTKIPMRERLVFLCQLGHGASSTVYKALDLTELRLVAVKMIPVFDRTKRRQMVRELNALFQMLRKKEKELANPSSPTAKGHHVNINFDLKARRLQQQGQGSEKQQGSEKRRREEEEEEEFKEMISHGGCAGGGNSGSFKLYSQQYIVDFYDAFRSVSLSLPLSPSFPFPPLPLCFTSLSLSLSFPPSLFLISLSLSVCVSVAIWKKEVLHS
jgi:hypothetical protein